MKVIKITRQRGKVQYFCKFFRGVAISTDWIVFAKKFDEVDRDTLERIKEWNKFDIVNVENINQNESDTKRSS